MIAALASSLGSLHASGVVHADLKPLNGACTRNPSIFNGMNPLSTIKEILITHSFLLSPQSCA